MSDKVKKRTGRPPLKPENGPMRKYGLRLPEATIEGLYEIAAATFPPADPSAVARAILDEGVRRRRPRKTA